MKNANFLEKPESQRPPATTSEFCALSCSFLANYFVDFIFFCTKKLKYFIFLAQKKWIPEKKTREKPAPATASDHQRLPANWFAELWVFFRKRWIFCVFGQFRSKFYFFVRSGQIYTSNRHFGRKCGSTAWQRSFLPPTITLPWSSAQSTKQLQESKTWKRRGARKQTSRGLQPAIDARDNQTSSQQQRNM